MNEFLLENRLDREASVLHDTGMCILPGESGKHYITAERSRSKDQI